MMATVESRESASEGVRMVGNLSLDPDLDGVDLRVFLYLFARLDFREYTLIEQRDIAQALGRRKEHISRSIRKLKAKEIIIEASPRIGRSPSYALNPKYGK
jgi:DNA-binding Lrp family transcriptional regulator